MSKFMLAAAACAVAFSCVFAETNTVEVTVTPEPVVTFLAPPELTAVKDPALLSVISNLNERILFLESELANYKFKQKERHDRILKAREDLKKNHDAGKVLMHSSPVNCTPAYQEAKERLQKKFPRVHTKQPGKKNRSK